MDMKLVRITAIAIVSILCIPGLLVMISFQQDSPPLQDNGISNTLQIPAMDSGVVQSFMDPLQPANPNMSLNILVTLGFRNQATLNSTLNELQNPLSKNYHKYLTASEFIAEFSPTAQEYDSYVNYFRSQGLNITNTYADRISIGVTANVAQVDTVFHTSIMYYQENGSRFYAPSKQLSMDVNFGSISGVSGLSDQFKLSISPMFEGGGSSQTLYGADLQNAYQLNKLYQEKGYPTNETIATILWSGTNATGSAVGPFVPSDISTYFANNLPSGEPRSTFYAYPVSGAPLPGPSAANDTTGANYESTLDLEMAGSTAPGATLVEVYGPKNHMNYLDEAFAAILNPSYNTTVDNALSRVVAISNSWGGTDSPDSAWSQYEQEAAVRGITVLAASGDNGNTQGTSPSFPASVGYNSYGTLGVGGTQTELSGNASSDGSGTTGISSQAVWYNTPNYGDGSQGGVSSMYSEPSWQVNSTDANAVINSVQSGRGTPDIAAVGANMLIYITLSGSSQYLELWGTSVASPLDAGLIATIDSYMGTPEGFLNPFIYEIGQSQYQGTYAGPPPFYFIYNGSNAVYSSARGYNLVTGWGSINAYNFVMAQENTYMVSFSESGLPAGTQWSVNFSNGGSLSSSSKSFNVLLANGTYSYTVATDYKNYKPDIYLGEFTLQGHNLTIPNITFSPVTYQVTFMESGLPTGTTWYTNITGGQDLSSTTSTISTDLMNGTYAFSIATTIKTYSSPGSSFTIHGSTVLVPVPFSKVNYSVTFVEKGLPSGAKWFVNISGISSYPSSTPTVNVNLTNGSYSYSVGTNDNRYVSHGGIITVDGSSFSENVTFDPVTYNVTFTETNLPPGTKWLIDLSNIGTLSSTSGNTSVNLTNGTYNYSTLNTTYYYSPLHKGSFTVSGKHITVSIQYYHFSYLAGGVLPSVANLSLNGKSYVLNASGTFNISLETGNYSLVISAPGYRTYYDNFSLGTNSVKLLNMSLQKIETPSASPYMSYVYYIIAGVAIVGAAGISVFLLKRKK